MPFTQDRTGVTAAELNSFWELARTNLASSLPYNYRGNVGSIDIDESDEIAGDVVDRFTALEALASLAALTQPNLLVRIERNIETTDFIMRPLSKSQIVETSEQSDSETQIFDITLRNGSQNVTQSLYSYINEVEFAQIQFTSAGGIKSYDLQTNDLKDGWYIANSIGESTFENTGFDNWAVGITHEISRLYLGDYGVDTWTLNKAYNYTAEKTWEDFPEGISPTPSGGGCDLFEDLTSQVNGSNTTFTVSQEFVSDCIKVFYNGQRIRSGSEYNVINGTQFTTTFVPTSTSTIFVDYVAS